MKRLYYVLSAQVADSELEIGYFFASDEQGAKDKFKKEYVRDHNIDPTTHVNMKVLFVSDDPAKADTYYNGFMDEWKLIKGEPSED